MNLPLIPHIFPFNHPTGDDPMQAQPYYVCGTIIVPIYFPVYGVTKEQALIQVKAALSSQTISVLDGDIHTWNGKSYPIIARHCRTIWTDVAVKEEVF
jgi:hypothetical protein